ncbi:MAG: BlaI/MecI/CopY family transcriptional regulator [Lachnospiraceae bacterium]|nr:BlaI/MecI/CopY family transcriptional regulator [Lachnospiraceae bacterium]
MVGYNLGMVESSFADLVWENEPLQTSELIELCKEKFNWKRTTTYTVLKRLCEGGIFKLENSTVSSQISRESFYSAKSEKFVEESFNGSLPAFLAAFTKRKKLSEKDINEIRKMIDSYDPGK